MPRISIVIPCYNAQRYLRGAIDSVLGQTFQDLEIVVVDDGSTDGTRELVAGVQDERLRYIYQENRGPAAARNHGIAAAQGEYIALLDADDLALPRRLEGQLAVLEAAPDLAVVGSGYVWIDEEGRRLSWATHSWQAYPELNAFRNWLFDCPFVPSATMFRRVAWRDVGGFDEELTGPEDWNFWMRLALHGCRMTWHREVVCLYRHRPDSLSEDAERMSAHSAEAVRRIMQHPKFPPELFDAAQQGLAVRYVDGSKRLYRAGLWSQGRAALQKAVDLDPTLLRDQPSRLEDELVSAALDPLVADPIQFLASLFDHLPPSALELTARQRHVLTRGRVELLVRGLRYGKPSLVRQHLGPALVRLPGWLLDAGTRATIVRALRGRRQAAAARLWGRR